MNRKPTIWDKAMDFFGEKGFYLAVLICVAVIGLSAYFLIQGLRGGLNGLADEPVSGSASITVTPSPQASPSTKPTPTPTPTPSPTPSPTPTPAAVEQTIQASPEFVWPVKGTVSTTFSVEALAYNETMGDWRTHDGIDIDSSLGTPVLSTSNGQVTDIYEDDLMGTTVVVEHANGMTSLYANLEAQTSVSVGTQVYAGDILGTVGDTAVAESGQQPHLHFAMYQDQVAVNPEDYLP